MTMDEITKLVDDFGRVSAVEGDADLPHSEVWIESRAALLRAVEGIERERDRAESALVARHGGEPLALLTELDEARDRADRLLSERDAASATAQRIAERLAAAESALAAMREAGFRAGVEHVAARLDAKARASDLGATFAGGPLHGTSIFNFFDGAAKQVRALASPPLAALSTETDAVVACNCLETLVHHQPRCPNYGRTDGWRPTPTKSKEDPTP